MAKKDVRSGNNRLTRPVDLKRPKPRPIEMTGSGQVGMLAGTGGGTL